jgi:hypothetical protein
MYRLQNEFCHDATMQLSRAVRTGKDACATLFLAQDYGGIDLCAAPGGKVVGHQGSRQ